MTDIYFDFFLFVSHRCGVKGVKEWRLNLRLKRLDREGMLGEEGMLERYGRICFVAEKKKNINKDSSTLLGMHFCNAKSVLLATVIKS